MSLAADLRKRRLALPVSNLEARDLRLVQAIAEAGGATRAANVLHLSQSAVSHQLRGLEERLGLPVFVRDGRSLRITPAGERLLELARQVLTPMLQAELELKRGIAERRRKLRITTQCYSAYYWLPRALTTLFARHPDVDLTLVPELLDDVASALEEDRLDLALCVSPLSARRFSQVQLFEDELVLAVPRGHPLARKKFVDGRDLTGETLIMTEVAKQQGDKVKRALFKHGGSFAKVVRIPIADAVLEVIAAGVGVGILAGFSLRQRVERGEIESVRLTRRGLRRTWTGVFRKRTALEEPIRSLLEIFELQAIPTRSK